MSYQVCSVMAVRVLEGRRDTPKGLEGRGGDRRGKSFRFALVGSYSYSPSFQGDECQFYCEKK